MFKHSEIDALDTWRRRQPWIPAGLPVPGLHSEIDLNHGEDA